MQPTSLIGTGVGKALEHKVRVLDGQQARRGHFLARCSCNCNVFSKPAKSRKLPCLLVLQHTHLLVVEASRAGAKRRGFAQVLTTWKRRDMASKGQHRLSRQYTGSLQVTDLMAQHLSLRGLMHVDMSKPSPGPGTWDLGSQPVTLRLHKFLRPSGAPPRK